MTAPEPSRAPQSLAQTLKLVHSGPGLAQRIAAIKNDPAAQAAIDAELAAADQAEHEARRELQARNRHAAYLRRRPARYAAAGYGMLTDRQAHGGKIARWWDSGIRALVLQGPSRTGKTTAAYAIGNAVHATGAWVEAWTAADLSEALKPDRDEGAYDRVVRCDLLILDDLGRERATEWWLEHLQRVVDARCSDERRLVVTANEDPAALIARYGDPLVERILDGAGRLLFDGPAVREARVEW